MTMSFVTLRPSPAGEGALAAIVRASEAHDVKSALKLARTLGAAATPPGAGNTLDLWEALATVAAHDLGVARAIEPHLDALAILAQASLPPGIARPSDATWGVFAAEGGNDPLTATRIGDHWSLTGTKPWCSLADRLDRALVTAHLPGGGRGLFALDLHSPGVSVMRGVWHSRGLADIPSGPVVFLDVIASAVGEPEWYLDRPGFAWGGIGVAACWYGGAVGIARTLYEQLGPTPEPLAAAHLGAADQELQSARRALAESGELVDRQPDDPEGSVLAKRVRAAVAGTCEAVLRHAAHALGPAPLALIEEHAKRVSDLELYVRQHHAERDDASLGMAIARAGQAPW
ncbi:MAG TPA: acyl-CoA dehydrogenase [Galbitalea sp.]|jgi:alkylation response protein AidB-like acyl-CoA dehydrogenase|nr:acyl-CoA dehydrogenase [Galbitalea sp.]